LVAWIFIARPVWDICACHGKPPGKQQWRMSGLVPRTATVDQDGVIAYAEAAEQAGRGVTS
jgi:hypothetical protein